MTTHRIKVVSLWTFAFLYFGCSFLKVYAHSYHDLHRATDKQMQVALEKYIENHSLLSITASKNLSIALVDVTNLEDIRVAEVNGDLMLYAASLPKIAIMLGVFQRIEEGELKLNSDIKEKLIQMIRHSSNSAASELLDVVGKEYLAQLLQSDQYKFYDKERGGIWVGKHYSRQGAWKRDPLYGLSHGASSLEVAKFYYMLITNQLVSKQSCVIMREILSQSGIKHKFVRGMETYKPDAKIYRKSGTWKTYHSDSALIERDGRKYIAVALINHPDGDKLLSDLIVAMDEIIFSTSAQNMATKTQSARSVIN